MIPFDVRRATIAHAAVFALCFSSGALAIAGENERAAAPYADRWLYCGFNMQVDRSVDDLTVLFARAKRSGYTGILLSDYKFQVLYRVPESYFRNVKSCGLS